MKEKTFKIIETALTVALFIFGLFIIYQILKKIFGGSWATEGIIISLLMFNLGLTFTIIFKLEKSSVKLARLSSDHSHLENQFKSLVSDFKNHSKK